MYNQKVARVLKYFLIFGSFYLIVDGLIHLFDIRLVDTSNLWPVSAHVYASLLDRIYASFVTLTAFLCFVVQKDLNKYRQIIYLSAFWAFLHGLMLIFIAISLNFPEAFGDVPSLRVWMPFYNLYLIFESILLVVYSVIVYLWFKHTDEK